MSETQNAALVGFVTALAICILLVLTKRWHGKLSLDGTYGVQKYHTTPTPRVGGIGLLLGLCAAWTLLPHDHVVEDLLGPMLLAGQPAFVFGTAEDVTKRVGVRERLLATIASGVLAWWITGICITRVDLWGIDALLTWVPLSVTFTAFAVGGVANAVNIIDGFNGLASGVVIICFSAIGLIAHQTGDAHLTQVCLVLASVTAGFLLVNFPFGKIFLGDGGAYLMGFLLAWVAVLLPARNPAISPWAALLACGYPILEVLFSIWRRHQRNLHPGHPDRLHMHSLVMSRMVSKQLGHWPPVLRNSAVSPLIWIFSLVPASLSVVFAQSNGWLIGSFVLGAGLYAVFYAKLVHFGWKLTKSRF